MTAFKEMTPSELAAGCRQVQRDASHEPYCFELFRRAILQKNEQCWSALYAQYTKMVAHWVGKFIKEQAPLVETPTEDLVATAYAAFWKSFTAEKLGQAAELAQVLGYLRRCAATAVLGAKRHEERRIKGVVWDQAVMAAMADQPAANNRPEQLVMTTAWQEKLWQLVNRCCHDERERVLARLSFVADLKPSEILERHPDLFTDVTEIYTMRRNLKNRLRRDQALQALWGESIL